MKFKFTIITALLLSLSSSGVYSIAGAQSPDRAVFHVLASPSSIYRLDTSTPAGPTRADIGCTPSTLLKDTQRHHIYVLCDGSRDIGNERLERNSTLLVLNSDSLTEKKRIPLGWRIHKLQLLSGGKILVALSAHKPADKSSPEEPATVFFVDADSMSIVSTVQGPKYGSRLNWHRQYNAFYHGHVLLENSDILVNEDTSLLYLLTYGGTLDKGKLAHPTVTTYNWSSKAAVAVTELTHACCQEYFIGERQRDGSSRGFWALSKDRSALYVVAAGKSAYREKNVIPGMTFQLNATTGKVVSTKETNLYPAKPLLDPVRGTVLVGSGPKATKRFAPTTMGLLSEFDTTGKPVKDIVVSPHLLYLERHDWHEGILASAFDELRFIGDGTQNQVTVIPLKASKIREDDGKLSKQLKLSEGPGREYVYFKDLNLLAFQCESYVRTSHSEPDGRVGIVDLAEKRLLRIVSPGRSGVKVGKVFAELGLSMVLSMASGAAGGYNSGSYVMVDLSKRGTSGTLAATPDGKLLAALNAHTDDLTFMEPKSGQAVDHLPLDGASTFLVRTPEGRIVFAVGKKKVAAVDLMTRKIISESPAEMGSMTGLQLDHDARLFIAMFKSGLLLIGAADGKIRSRFDSISNAGFAVRTE